MIWDEIQYASLEEISRSSDEIRERMKARLKQQVLSSEDMR